MTNYKKISESETTLTELMIPSYANFGGKVHGGILLSLMDKIAYVCGTKHCENYCVTVSVEGVEFLNPVEVGDLVHLMASVNYVGNTTMIIGIRVESVNPRTKITKHTNSCYFTMAAKDENGNLTKVPGLLLENETQIRRFCEGKMIKNFSKEKRDILKSDLYNLSAEERNILCDGEKCEIIS
jgi:acyl-CoA hydrolase